MKPKGNTVHKRGPAEKTRNKAHFGDLHSVIGPKSGIKPDKKTWPSHVSKHLRVTMLPYWTKLLTLKKKKKQRPLLKKYSKERVLFAWTPFPADVEASTEATTELSSAFWSSIPIWLSVVPSPPVKLLPTTVWPPLLKFLIHSRSSAMSLRMRIRSFTISVTSLTLKFKLLQKKKKKVYEYYWKRIRTLSPRSYTHK